MKDKLKRKIERTESKIALIKRSHGEQPYITHTYHGGWDLGYWQGKLAAYEYMLDLLEDEEAPA